MVRKPKLFLALFLGTITILGAVLAFMTPAAVPFEEAIWKSRPATNRWVHENVRHRMSAGAAAEAKKCRNVNEVYRLLGEPEGISNYGIESKPRYSYSYWLGHRRHPIMFWKPMANVRLVVMCDELGEVVSAGVLHEGN